MLTGSPRPRWTISVLTIPQRTAFLSKLLESLGDAGLPRGAVVDIVYNWDSRERPHDVEQRLRKVSRKSRDLAYAFGPGAPARDMLRSSLRLAPRLSGEYPAIARFRELVQKHPFPFMPFHRFSEQDVHDVVRHANTRIDMYRDDVWDTARVRAARWVGRRLAFA